MKWFLGVDEVVFVYDGGMKICKDCQVSQPLENFYKNPGGRDGHQNRCKECSKAAKRESNHNRGVHKRWYSIRPGQSKPPRSGVASKPLGWVGPAQYDEAAIYYLVKDEQVLYVGSTLKPQARWQNHRDRFGAEIQMVVVKWVPQEMRLLEESKEILAQAELGNVLTNRIDPVTRRRI